MRKLSLSAVALCLASCSQVSTTPPTNQAFTFVEEVTASTNEITIPYKKFTLENGLTVILHKDDSDPLVHVDVTYHVGSAREEVGKSGFAHFFEHMMFQGSENIADEQHFKIVTESGGTLNGTTNSDRTNYYQTVPANQLEKMLWLEADRMGFLLDAVTQEKFEVQRETVKNERGQRVDNRPYGRLNEMVSNALYPANHPYSWPTIGYMEDLNRVDVNDLKKFFLRWYGPNNATLTIGGDIDEAQTLAYIEKYFGSIPRGPEVTMPKKPKVTLAQDKYISLEDNVHLPLVYFSMPTVYVRHEDEAPLDILAQILGGGKTSILYKNLVKNQLAVQASVGHPCAELACTFNMYALPHPASGKSLADIEKIIRDSLVEFEERGVEEDDLLKTKAQMEAGFVFGLQSVSGKVSQLAANETFTKNPNYIQKDIARYSNVSKEDVMRVFKQYIKGKPAVIMSIVPKGKPELIAHEDTYTAPKREFEQTSTDSASLKVRKATDTFDRSVMPETPANAAASLPKINKATLSNGITLLSSQSTETPTTSLYIKVPAGQAYESLGKSGVSTMLAQMFNESTTLNSAESLSKKLEMLGSSISFGSGLNYLTVNVHSLTKNLEPTLQLLNEKLLFPAFLESEFSRIKNNTLQGIENNKKSASYLASTAYGSLLHGNTHAGLPSSGTTESVNKITVEDVKSFYNSFFKPSDSQLIAVSNLTQLPLLSQLEVLQNWKGKSADKPTINSNSTYKPKTIYIVNKDDAKQSAIRIGKKGIKKDITGEFYQSGLMNFPLGGAFNSRININLREDKGYTYGARSYLWGNKSYGGFSVSTEVRADVTDKSIIELIKELDDFYKNGITDDELAFMRKAINQRDALKYETPSAKLSFLSQILEYELAPSFVKERNEIVKSISKETINKLAKKHVNTEEMFMVVVGDSKTLTPQLEKLGYAVEQYSVK